ncbi:Lysoplasmalogenase-like protein TMEM86A [Nymphon striatum]|nr:Lysoplasmalogenase-like protein TMEM86A [Nymphon striatum]
MRVRPLCFACRSRGLVFSMLGDAFLIWKHLFMYGLISFCIAQFFYVSAFGLKPIKPLVGAICFSFLSCHYAAIYPYLKGMIFYCAPMYGLLICFMVWRAIARLQFFEDLWTWTKLCSCVGAVLFCISDSILAFNNFAFEIPHSQALIMVTYYGAQVGIALSVVDSMEGSHIIKNNIKEAKFMDVNKTGRHTLTVNHENVKN